MPKYLIEASYTAEGAKGLAREGGTSRRKAVEEMVKGVNGKLEMFYFAFGHSDVYAVVDVPDAATAAALSLAINQAGTVELTSHVLITPDEMDAAAKKSVGYRPPGK